MRFFNKLTVFIVFSIFCTVENLFNFNLIVIGKPLCPPSSYYEKVYVLVGTKNHKDYSHFLEQNCGKSFYIKTNEFDSGEFRDIEVEITWPDPSAVTVIKRIATDCLNMGPGLSYNCNLGDIKKPDL